MRLKVNPEKVISTGTVDADNAGKIVDEITWRISQNGLYRNDLMLLDIITTNNWERPIYFANPNSVSGVLNIDKFCHLEGIVYRFKPMLAENYYPKVGGINPDRSYEILTADDVRWGRLNEDDVVIDRESARNSGMIKQNYMFLAKSLVAQGKMDSAIQVLDTGIKYFPDEKIPFDYYMIIWADFYYQADAVEKGNEVIQKIYENYKEELEYYALLKNKYVAYYDEDIRVALSALQGLGQLAREHDQKEKADEIEETLNMNLNMIGM
jgi:tetratricopeptide (TPR) repeat protein